MIAVLRSLAFYLCFYTASVGFVLSALAVIPVGDAAVRKVVHGWTGFHRWCVVHLLGIEIVVEGGPSAGPALYAIRHESFFEAIDAPVLFDLPAPFAKAELFAIPGWGRAAAAFGVVEVRRDAGARALRQMVSEARSMVAKGRPLVIFPEGTRVPHGERRDLQSGFAGLYKLLGLPVIPVAVDSGPLYHRRWKRPGRITYRFGEQIPPGLPRAEIEARVIVEINALSR